MAEAALGIALIAASIAVFRLCIHSDQIVRNLAEWVHASMAIAFTGGIAFGLALVFTGIIGALR